MGILGGGQLALMLAEAAHRLGLHPIAFVESPEDPVNALCPNAVLSERVERWREPGVERWREPMGLASFLSSVEVIAFESEFFPVSVLDEATRALRVQVGEGPRFFPSLSSIKQLQDKLNQKVLLSKLQIPTAPHLQLDLEGNWKAQLKLKRFQDGVLKWAKYGYDGKGNCFLPARAPQVERFCEQARGAQSRVFVEERIEFAKELAILAVRSKNGEFTVYPIVETRQSKGVCQWVRVGLKGFDSEDLQRLTQEATEIAKKIAVKAQLVGVFAIEFFLDHSNKLWVNEIAPRVHNSGHWTQDAPLASQFENHWRALLGMPLGSTQLDASWGKNASFGMWNVLGKHDGEAEQVRVQWMAGLPPGARLHWYGKRFSRPGRKLGHVNWSGELSEQCLKKRAKEFA